MSRKPQRTSALSKVLAVLVVLAFASVLALLMVYRQRHPSRDHEKKDATLAVEQFHQRWNAGDFAGIYDNADDALKKSLPREGWLRFAQDFSARSGKFQHIVKSELEAIEGNPLRIHAACHSNFDKGSVSEVFDFVKRGGEIRLAYFSAFPEAGSPSSGDGASSAPARGGGQ